MNPLEAYLATEVESVASLSVKMAEHMRIIKQLAESLEYRCLTDEAFRHSVAYLCVSVQSLDDHIKEAEAGIERFIQNTYRKWRTYFELQQDLLRLYTAKTLETVTRIPKMERHSNFNVIKINSHHIDIQYNNNALVVTDGGGVTTTTTTSPPPSLEIFTNPQSREVVTRRMREVTRRFTETQDKIRVYQAHYARLGNLSALKEERVTLACKMDEMTNFIEQSVLVCDESKRIGTQWQDVMREEMDAVMWCFDTMCGILAKERENCEQYVFNTVNRFIECSTTYYKLVTYLKFHNIEIASMDEGSVSLCASVGTAVASMYFVSDTATTMS